MRAACLRLNGTLLSKTPTFIGCGDGATNRSLEYIPGSFIRGAFGIAMIRAFCVKPDRVNNHDSCEAKNGCPYFQLFSEDCKASNIIFRYAYPEHVGCPKDGAYYPLLSNGSTSNSRRMYVCSGCGHVTSNPISLMKMSADGLIRESGRFVEVIPPETPFRLDVILALKVEYCVDFVAEVLTRALLKDGVGRWKSFGFGRFTAKINVEEITIDNVEERAGEIDGSKLVVRLLSPTIVDGAGFLKPSVLLEAARRAYSRILHRGKPRLPEVRLKRKVFRVEKHGGWSLKNGGPRQVLTAISAGSLFEFECDVFSSEFALALASLECYALGAYKPHGCGQVVIEKGYKAFEENCS